MKDFAKWIALKEKLDKTTYIPPLFKEGEVWWCSIGANVGHEINGKSELFSRPVVVFKKLSKDVFIGIPLSTKQKVGSWYVPISHKERSAIANISQLRLFDFKRLSSKYGELDKSDFDKIKKCLKALLNF